MERCRVRCARCAVARTAGENVFACVYRVRPCLAAFPNHRARSDRTAVSRPYRAPETIFGPVQYDPFAVDLWSLGAVLAEFFTGFTFESEDEDEFLESPASDDAENVTVPPYRNIERYQKDMLGGRWYRDSLFDASRGAIGLAWSIFKIRGTPTAESWPVRHSLPSQSQSMSLNIDIDPAHSRSRSCQTRTK